MSAKIWRHMHMSATYLFLPYLIHKMDEIKRRGPEEYWRKEPLRRLLLQSLRLTTPPLPLPAAGEVVYLPISMGYRSCYKRNMLSLGLHTKVSPAVFTIDIIMMGDSCHGPAGQVGRIRDNHPQ